MPLPTIPTFEPDQTALDALNKLKAAGYTGLSGGGLSGGLSGGGGTGAGNDIFGYRPAPIPLPRPKTDIAGVVPGYQSLIDTLSGNLMNSLSGNLPQPYINALQDTYNARAQQAGVGGSPFAGNAINYGVAKDIMAQQNLATNQLLNYLTTQKNTATLDPALQAEIAHFNSLMAASPNPAAYANWVQEQFKNQMAQANPTRPTPGLSYAAPRPDYTRPSGGSVAGGGFSTPVWSPAPVVGFGSATSPTNVTAGTGSYPTATTAPLDYDVGQYEMGAYDTAPVAAPVVGGFPDTAAPLDLFNYGTPNVDQLMQDAGIPDYSGGGFDFSYA